MTTVEVELLEAGYDSEHVLIKDLFFTIEKGKTLGLVGVNGSGKTTAILAMLGMLPYVKGEMRIVERTGQYSFIPEQPSFYEGLTMHEHILLVSSINNLNTPEDQARIQALIEGFNLTAYIHQYPTTFSKGDKQKFSILLGLIKKADLYIFDDPFSCIDIKAKCELIEEIKRLTAGDATVLIAATASSMCEDVCDSYLYIHNNTLYLAASQKHIKVKCEHEESPSLDCFYHLDVRRSAL